MKQIITILALLGLASVAGATEAPSNEPTERIIPDTTHAIVGQLVSCVRTNEPGSHVLSVSITPIRSLWGDALTNAVDANYREFMLPNIPEGMSVCFANYTGSGIEWDSKPKQKYICFLKKEKKAFSLLRLEPVANEKKILDLYNKQKAEAPTKP
jgi:hypothetical protein